MPLDYKIILPSRWKKKAVACILLRKITAVQSEVALSYHKMRRLYFLAVIFAATLIYLLRDRGIKQNINNMEHIYIYIYIYSSISTR